MDDTPDWVALTGHPVLLTNIVAHEGGPTADVHLLGTAVTYTAATLPEGVAAQAAGNAGTRRTNLGVFDGTKLAAATPDVAILARQHLATITQPDNTGEHHA